MKVNILVECPELIVSAQLGVLDPLRPLEQQGKCELLFLNTIEVRKKHILWADILITVRGGEALSVEIVKAAKKAGRFIIYYLDDDLLHIPEESISWDYYHDPQMRQGITLLLSLSDVLWGVNPQIRERYLPLTNGRWMENKLPCKMAESLPELSRDVPVQVLYAGSVDHQILVKELLSPVVRRLAAEYGPRVDFTFIGANPEIADCANVRYLPFIQPYEQYRAFVERGGFSIGLAPARDDAFYACKYFNKFVEYGSVGAVGVYSAVAPYTDIVEDGENGLLCQNEEENWYQAIRRLVEDFALTQRCRGRIMEQLRRDFAAEQVAQDLEQQCEALVSFHAPVVVRKDVHFVGGFLWFYWGRLQMLWRSRGIRGIPEILFKTVKVLFKQGIARVRHFVQ